MLHKLREVMGQHDGRYKLAGMVETDDGFFSTETEEEKKNDKKKRGRGSQSKTPVPFQVLKEEDVGKVLPWVHSWTAKSKIVQQ